MEPRPKVLLIRLPLFHKTFLYKDRTSYQTAGYAQPPYKEANVRVADGAGSRKWVTLPIQNIESC